MANTIPRTSCLLISLLVVTLTSNISNRADAFWFSDDDEETKEVVTPLPKIVEDDLEKNLEKKKTPYDVKVWIQSVLEGDYEDAAHQWAGLQLQIPSAMRHSSEAAFLYMLWRLDLPQTFIDRLLHALRNPRFRKSKSWTAVEPILAKNMANLLFEHAILYTQAQKTLLTKLPWTGLHRDLKAWAYLRTGKRARIALKHLPAQHPWRRYLETGVTLADIRAGKTKQAMASLTKTYNDKSLQEPIKSAYALQIARLHYQRAALKKAEGWYVKVKPGTPEYVDAREELLWVWLRKGDTSKVRGTLETLVLPEFKEELHPEIFVVRAISNLKLCYYDKAKLDFDQFVAYNSSWAEKIDTALNAPTPAAPPNPDWYTKMIERGAKARDQEMETLKDLFEESLGASLPAVGKQKHWRTALKNLAATKARLKRQLLNEYKRQWRNNAIQMKEGIRKMRFVRIELISQLKQGIVAKPESNRSEKKADEAQDVIDKAAAGRWSFPFDGITWPDELFAARSAAHNVCL